MNVIRISLVIWLIVAGGVAFGLYQLKYEVQHLEQELSSVRQDIRDNRNALHVLEAEWSYLNRPARIERLAEKHLDMQATTPRQVAAVTQLQPRITQQMPTQAVRAERPTMDGVPLPLAKPWSLEPRYASADRPAAQPAEPRGTQTAHAEESIAREPAQRQTASAAPTPETRPRTQSEARTEPRPEARTEPGAQVASADARTISIGHIKISLGGAQ